MLSLERVLTTKRAPAPSLVLIQFILVSLQWGSIALLAISVLLGGSVRFAGDALGGFLLTGVVGLIYWHCLIPLERRRSRHLHDHAFPWCAAMCCLGELLILQVGTRASYEFGIALIGAGVLFWLSMVVIKLLR